jgi:hypothetical protein
MAMTLVEGVLTGFLGALSSYVFQRRAAVDNTLSTLKQTTAVALTKLSTSMEHVARELAAIREEMREERVEMFSRIRACEKDVTEVKAYIHFGPSKPWPDHAQEPPSDDVRYS